MKKKIPIIYIGRRVFDHAKGEITDCFLHGEEEMHFKHVRARWLRIGYSYEGTQSEKTVSIPKSNLNEIENADARDPKKMKEWETRDLLAEGFVKRVRAAKRGQSRAAGLARELHSLRSLCAEMNATETRNFLDTLADEIWTLNRRAAR